MNLSNSIEIIKTEFVNYNLKLTCNKGFHTFKELNTSVLNEKIQLEMILHYLRLN